MATREITALVCGGATAPVEFRAVPAPEAVTGEVRVGVRAVSVNRGELHRLTDQAVNGWRPGWDLAGEVLGHHPSATAFPVGTRVFGMCHGGSWAQEVVVAECHLAPVPPALSYQQAAALPAAALTAVRTLRLAGSLAGRAVLVIGASGGVGRFAVQLARRAGARVTAVAGGRDRAAGLQRLGADHVVTGLHELAPGFDLVLESAGGDSLAAALSLVGRSGLVVSYGNSSRASTRFSVSDFYPKQAQLCGFYLLDDIVAEPPGADLRELARLCANGELSVEVGMEADWAEVGSVLSALRDRRVPGKAVLRLGPAGGA
ncbi:zinc-binding dehydrogenase [Amycolatopsis sp. 195334CR]|uniref:zinc-binding dehydrogenase n=1 Tax=Amycolatopsis sp. 195334CR TaxID=2814588 RepID=UPI001A8FE5C8|nr:zinc-binding dehydrogenase [Amycolatopsis sp. 195334CR]MBN6038821.1 zinc-binding dehydrogenase [Amycolatopsis sp. 195334CR]